MAVKARYKKIEPQTDEEKLLLERIEDLEEQLDKVQTAISEHKHNVDGDVVLSVTWMF